jgi:hypothetical protein
MSSTSEMRSTGSFRAWARSLPVRLAIVPLAGLGVFGSTHSALAGVGMSTVLLGSVLAGLRVDERRRRRLEAGESIAGLPRF